MYYICTDNNYSSKLGKGVPEGFPRPESQLYFAFNEIQMLMAMYENLNKATEEEIDSLSVHIVRIYLSGVEESLSFCYRAGETSLWLAARIMETHGYQPFINLMETQAFSSRKYLDDAHPYMLAPDMQARFMLHFNDFIEDRLE